MFNKEEPSQIDENLSENLSEKKQEKTPVFPEQEQRVIDEIDGSIESKEKFFVGLGRIAKEEIFNNNPEALEEIYALKKVDIDGVELKKDDAEVLKTAGMGLRARHVIKRVLTLGFAGSKHALKDEGRLVDKRKLRKGVEGQEHDLSVDELAEVAEEFGIDPEEIHQKGFQKIYTEGETGVEKTILREKTDQEADQTAGKIFKEQLKKLETESGGELVKCKEKLEAFQKDVKQYTDILDPETMSKLNKEELALGSLKDEKQEKLDSDLEIIKSPLQEHQKELDETLENFLALSSKVADQSATYDNEIKILNNKINKIKGSRVIKGFLEDEINKWQEQKTQTEANKKSFIESKKALEIRITQLKKNKTEIDNTLIRINNIGKTSQELTVDREEKEKIKKEKVKKESSKVKEKTENINLTSDVKSEPSEVDDNSKDENEKKKLRQEILAKHEDWAKSLTGKEKSKTKKKRPVKSTVESTVPDQKKAEADENNKEGVKKPVKDWLALLGIQNTGEQKKIVEDNFVVGMNKKFDITAPMPLYEARIAYAACLFKYREEVSQERAKALAKAKFEQIIKNLY
ncbi:hypothetical protein KKA93_02445 [Patescibacteria group bacterium]|nr:hypothetical protein [Patescibacteria group bacterium]MBU1663666.1 hypothetical protein [Patescibacteria group bacterium]MBU1934145.1 hypothetical protein [Patescibacteria group bacterium]MBU2007576.1 hypothetical protein [Patescibacteria group bacterium]MBU2233551.1 hypothetical protein [Patescibacteria group bacterium]